MKRRDLGDVATVFALGRRVFGGEEKGAEERNGSAEKQQGLSEGSGGQGR